MPALYDMTQTHLDVSSPENMDVPQRSRNARAQARHRAKRKAYIEKLEENVAKLQAALGLSSEQVSNLPSAAVLTNRFAELEMENRRLHEQLRNLQHAFHSQQYQNGPRWSPESPTVSDFPSHGPGLSVEDGCYGRKKRRISMDGELSYTNGHSILGNNAMGSPSQSASNPHVSRAHPPLGGSASVNQAAARGHSADSLSSLTNLNNLTSTSLTGNPYTSSFSHTANPNNNANNGTSANHISIKSEPSFGEMSILSTDLTASPITALPPHRQYQHQQQIATNGQLQNHQAPGSGHQYRASISALDRDQRHQPTQSTYAGIVENAARSIFGPEDDGYMPSHQGSPMETRAYNEYSDYNEQQQRQQQQYLAHERLATLSQQSQSQTSQPSTQNGSPTNTNGSGIIPLPYPSPTETHRGSISHHLPPNVYGNGSMPSPGLGPGPGSGPMPLGNSSPSWPTGVAISLKRV